MKNLTIANRWNANLIDDQYNKWLSDPESVTPQWRAFLEGFELGNTRVTTSPEKSTEVEISAKQEVAQKIVERYRTHGHLQAHINPLEDAPASVAELSPQALGITAADLLKPCQGVGFSNGTSLTLKELISKLQATYCQHIGYEFMHIQDLDKREWLRQKIESLQNNSGYTAQKKKEILKQVIHAEVFEDFLHTHFVGHKRFSLEGGESLIPALYFLVERMGEINAKELIFGMAHRGRLNVLVNILDKPLLAMMREFSEKNIPDAIHGDWDVKYHIGFEKAHKTSSGTVINLTLASNPSHLESINPVVEGIARARQHLQNDPKRKQVIPLLIHGDASFMGQGVVAETFNFSRLQGYTTGGTLHVVINNQIGFTTNPVDDRSSRYCTDIAKIIDAPVFHVNGDDAMAATMAMELALEYRQTFGEDAVLDICCYRKYGHNETDEPRFTQPKLYEAIAKHPKASQVLIGQLSREASEADSFAKTTNKAYTEALEKAYQEFKALESKANVPTKLPNKFQSFGKNGFQPAYDFTPVQTAVSEDLLKQIGKVLTSYPKDFSINSKIKRQIETKIEALKSGIGFDWSMGELLAYGTLLHEGTPIRLSGQDCIRGTFSHRHATFFDSKTGEGYTPLAHIAKNQPCFTVYNSPLSEFGILGFDYGYSLGNPKKLCIWEAQFGDFANGAQTILDQYITSAESKWHNVSGIVLLLPHGYQGQGPEHSSARLERYLQACAEDNIQVCCPTTPAQLFHLLRRQMKRSFKKPLIIMSPKNLLRHKDCVSNMADFTSGYFEEILPDPEVKKAKRLILCTGKIYFELLDYQRENKVKDTAIIRLEQLYPLHAGKLEKTLSAYEGHKEVVWCQEEPQNMGAWSYIFPQLIKMYPKIQYAGREKAASTATGYSFMHRLEQADLIEKAFN